MVINSHGNSRGGLKTTLKGSLYRELSSELVTQIEKLPPAAAQRDGKRLSTLENNKLFLKIDHGKLIPHKGSTSSLTQLYRKIAATSSNHRWHQLVDTVSRTLHHKEHTLPTTLQPNLTLPNSTTTSSSHSVQRPISVPSKSPPLRHWKQGKCQNIE